MISDFFLAIGLFFKSTFFPPVKLDISSGYNVEALQRKSDRVIENSTTRDEVQSSFGTPFFRNKNDSIWVYAGQKTFRITGAKVTTRFLTLEIKFNEKDVVSKKTLKKSLNRKYSNIGAHKAKSPYKKDINDNIYSKKITI